ncbi:MAG: FtsX-like permease family protein [Acidobacteria bacterium]|nr:FtsX-like permease family protein [Acidobacteriota bacterium]
MIFSMRLAWREIRASWRRLIFFFLSIAIGVGAIVCLRSLVQNLKSSVNGEARALLTADVQVSANAPWNDAARTVLNQAAQRPEVLARTEVIETATMLRAPDRPDAQPRMVELKAVQPDFPFYGELKLADGLPYSHQLLQNRGILVKQGTLSALNLGIGDHVQIGALDFTIRGVIEKEPGSSMNGFSLGPRVIIDYRDAEAAGLLGFGSRARFRTLFRTRPEQFQDLTAELTRNFSSQPNVSVRSFRNTQDRLSESLTQVEDYLSLVGLVILVLGGIGISSVTRVFVRQKMRSIAILKCLGGTNRRVLGAYLFQVLALGGAGSLFGLLLAQLAIIALPRYLESRGGRLPFDIAFELTPGAVLQGLGIGLLISLLFSLLPLLEIRRIKPILVLRSGDSPGGWRVDREQLLVGVIVLSGLLGLASWQAGSLRIGAIFLAGMGATTVILSLAATALLKFLRGLRAIPSFTLRQGINSLHRPGNQTRIILMAVGLGVFLGVAVRSLQLNLSEEFALDLDSLQADLYLIDIQRDQRAGVEEIITRRTGNAPAIIPTIRMRIAAINDREIKPDTIRPDENRGLLGREYVSTFRGALESNERIIDGRFWDESPSAEPEISIEELLHRELGLRVNDRVAFDVLGRRLTARVSSVRKVDWRNARTGFLIVFRPGSLNDAPTMYISAVRGPAAPAERARLQRELVDRFPNISTIDVRDIIDVAREIVSNVSLAISFVGGFVLLSGLLILIGSIAMTKFNRLYESAILKTLGAKRRLIILVTLIEYGLLGLLAGLLGSAAAVALTWAISEKALRISWHFSPGVNLLGILVALLLVTIVGVMSSWDVLIRKPLGILRNE